MSPKITSAEVEAADPLKTIEQWAAEKKSDPAMFAVAKATTPGWAIGRECTEKTFDAALERAANLSIR